MIAKQGRESWYHFVSSASVIKPIFVPVKVLMTSHGTEMLSPYQGGQSLRACAGLWAVGCLETLPDMLRYEVFNSIGKKKKKVLSGTWRFQIIITIYEFYWNPGNLAKESCKYFSPEWLRLPPNWKQSLQNSRDNFFLLHCPTDFLKHTEKIVHPLPASREAGKKAMGVNFVLFQASFSE